MATNPIKNSNQSNHSIIPERQARLERKLKNYKLFSRVFAGLAALATVGIGAIIVCASLALIPWTAAIIPIVIACSLIVMCLVAIKHANKNSSHLINDFQKQDLFPFPQESTQETLDPQQDPKEIWASLKELTPSSLGDFASILDDEKLKQLFFPSEDTSSINPTEWFSPQRLKDAFLQEWKIFTSTHHTYRYKTRETYLSLQSGDISAFKRTAHPGDVGAIVNSAEDCEIDPGLGSTGTAITTVITRESWEAAKEGKKIFKPSEVSAGKWVSQTAPNNNSLIPSFLIHVFTRSSYSGTDFEAYQNLIFAYKNCLEKAQSLGVTILQLPLLSYDPYSTPQWLNMNRLAFLAASTLFIKQNPSTCLKDIILMSPNQQPFSFS